MNEYYQSPLSQRYASKEMQALFSNDKKFTTWRRLWIALAESEKELGLDITEEQIEELKAHALDINYDVAKAREKEVRHDVMSHVYAYGVQCPKAKGIIHLGATSCYVGDNTDLIIMHEALELVQKKIVNVLEKLEEFALKYKDMPCLAFTHFQPAQPTTVGKRASLWAQDLYMDYVEIQHLLDNKKLLGCKGTTGTQASFMELFEGDTDKVKALDKKICEKLGYDQYFAVSGQTYTRKYDTQVLQVLVQIAQSAHKFSNDIRLLQHMKEIEEPFEVIFVESLLLFGKILLGQAIEFTIFFRLSDEFVQLIEQFSVALLHCDSPCLRILERNEDRFGGIGVRKVIAIDRELIVEEAISFALDHFGYTRAFICQAYDISIGKILRCPHIAR